MHFPRTPIRDAFDRADENPITGWQVPFYAATNNLKLVSNQLASALAAGSGHINTAYGEDMEAYVTVDVIGPGVELFICASKATESNYTLLVTPTALSLYLIVSGAAVGAALATVARTNASGDSFGIRRLGAQVEGWAKSANGVWTRAVTTTNKDRLSGGSIGMVLHDTTVRCSDLGGGTVDWLKRRKGEYSIPMIRR
jgi:hypothetical protein